ncbi:MAG TPA: hypothetical protein VMM57_09905 [Bacteroidota bacterium]|nr:hypothetical protein [Bacteroidota bacterium]
MESRGHDEGREIVLERSRAGGTEIPEGLLDRLHIRPGTRFTVRFKERVLSTALRKRGVTEAEIEKIAAIQLEPEANVVRFLASEGALGRHARFRKRSERLLR